MKPCVLKSYKNGVSVILSKELGFDEICLHVGETFKNAGDFLKNAKLAISFEGRELTHEEEDKLLDVIQENCSIQIICVVGKNEEQNQSYLKALTQLEYRHEDKNLGQFYKGNIKDGQVLETEYSLVVLGDVYPGCAVVSSKDIIVLGGLYGEAHAGFGGDDDRFVIALEMEPERLRIGNCRLKKDVEKGGFWPVKPKIMPKIAVVENDTVVSKPLSKSALMNLE